MGGYDRLGERDLVDEPLGLGKNVHSILGSEFFFAGFIAKITLTPKYGPWNDYGCDWQAGPTPSPRSAIRKWGQSNFRKLPRKKTLSPFACVERLLLVVERAKLQISSLRRIVFFTYDGSVSGGYDRIGGRLRSAR